eukprot:6201516-Pleurochrysis_carterae.AAC.1
MLNQAIRGGQKRKSGAKTDTTTRTLKAALGVLLVQSRQRVILVSLRARVKVERLARSGAGVSLRHDRRNCAVMPL